MVHELTTRSSAVRAIVAMLVVVVVVACGSKGWSVKATTNERIASDRVGGFTNEDRRLYHLGLQHVANRKENLGGFTIGQIVDQERKREEQRASIAAARAERQARARERSLAAEKIAPAVSSYASDIALMFQLDNAAYREMAAHARNTDMTGVYGTAQQALRGVEMLSGLRNKKPEGFDRTQDAVDAYRADMRHRYEAASEMANDPSPKTNYAFLNANGSEYGTHYVGVILKAFDNDLDGVGMPASIRTRLRDRIRGK